MIGLTINGVNITNIPGLTDGTSGTATSGAQQAGETLTQQGIEQLHAHHHYHPHAAVGGEGTEPGGVDGGTGEPGQLSSTGEPAAGMHHHRHHHHATSLDDPGSAVGAGGGVGGSGGIDGGVAETGFTE